MNTYKQVNVIIGLLLVGLVGTLLYYMFDDGVSVLGISVGDRSAVAAERQEQTTVDRGAFLFARYCRACHGLTGKGALERATLPGAPLNTDPYRPPTLASSQVAAKQQRLNGTITCGRVGTQMPPWLTDWGGPLNFYQIQQLVTLITSSFAPEGWDQMIEYGNESDAQNPAVFLTNDLDASAGETTLRVTGTGTFAENTFLRIGLDTPDEPYELMLIKSIDKTNNTITVERGPDVELGGAKSGSDPIEHKSGDEVYSFLTGLPPDTITGAASSTADAPCGQAKAAATPAASPGATPAPVAFTTGGTIELSDNQFGYNGQINPALTVAAATKIDATLNNTGSAAHDMRIAGPDGQFNTADDIVSDPDAIAGGKTGAISFTLAAGTYKYQCDFHPTQMLGTITAQ